MVFPFLRIHSIRGRDFTACVHESDEKKVRNPNRKTPLVLYSEHENEVQIEMYRS